MQSFTVPTRDQVSNDNQAIFDQLKGALGFVPNLYATMAHSDTALGTYLQFQNAKSSLSKKEQEVINLVVSQKNGCKYCQSAHTAISKMNGFSEDQILEIRGGTATFDAKLNALALLAKEVANNNGNIAPATLEQFFSAGYNQANLVDLTLVVGEITVTNYLHNITQVPVDFPLAVELETVNS